jgi:uncharacterized protein
VDFVVADVPDRERFEARDPAGELAGMLTYQVTGPIVAYTHTRIEARFEGQVVDAALAKAALDDARDRKRTVVPICPLLSAWLDKHPEYDTIVARSTRRIK